ncbi:hypothetical protein [Rhodobacter sp. NSM]|uniref:hypothetical protein n=1 Tax=Rhodobacter sp. NSM TaxID=3457501 RepID=UPI003FD01F2F
MESVISSIAIRSADDGCRADPACGVRRMCRVPHVADLWRLPSAISSCPWTGSATRRRDPADSLGIIGRGHPEDMEREQPSGGQAMA